MMENKETVVLWLLMLLGFMVSVHFSNYEYVAEISDGFMIGCSVSVVTWFVARLIDILL